jgi:hypothetical protein
MYENGGSHRPRFETCVDCKKVPPGKFCTDRCLPGMGKKGRIHRAKAPLQIPVFMASMSPLPPAVEQYIADDRVLGDEAHPNEG